MCANSGSCPVLPASEVIVSHRGLVGASRRTDRIEQKRQHGAHCEIDRERIESRRPRAGDIDAASVTRHRGGARNFSAGQQPRRFGGDHTTLSEHGEQNVDLAAEFGDLDRERRQRCRGTSLGGPCSMLENWSSSNLAHLFQNSLRIPQHLRNLAPLGDCFGRIISVLEGILVTLWGARGHAPMHGARLSPPPPGPRRAHGRAPP
jgi:hypothetical protein